MNTDMRIIDAIRIALDEAEDIDTIQTLESQLADLTCGYDEHGIREPEDFTPEIY